MSTTSPTINTPVNSQQHCYPQGSFLHRAEVAAKQEVREWIRKTFKETFFQAFQKQLIQIGDRKNNHDDDGEEDKLKWKASDLQACISLVNKVSMSWQQELRLQRHFKVAEWVQDVFDTGKDCLWSQESNTNMTTNETALQKQPQQDHRTNNFAQASTPVISVEQDKSDSKSELVIPYCKLRKLGKRSIEAIGKTPILDPTEAAAQLQAMGQQKQPGESYWPLSHTIIDEAVAEIPNRVKNEQGSNSSYHSSSKLQYQLVPKTAKERRQQQHTGSSTQSTTMGKEEQSSEDISQRVLTALAERKRKNFKEPREELLLRPNKEEEEPARPPSNVSSSTHNVNDELSESEKMELDTLIHPDHDNVETDEPASIFGALCNVGQIRANRDKKRRQKAFGEHESTTVDDELSDKQRRRQERAFIKERLWPRMVEKNQDPQRYRSKILRTMHRTDNSKRYMDFDMGWSMLEYEWSGEKRLLALSTIEATLEEL